VNGHSISLDRVIAIQERSILIQERTLLDQAVHHERTRFAIEQQARALEILPHRLAEALRATAPAPASTPAPAPSSSPSHHDWIELLHAARRLLMVSIPFLLVLLLGLGRVTMADVSQFAAPLMQSSGQH
jgi:hypothetical protein